MGLLHSKKGARHLRSKSEKEMAETLKKQSGLIVDALIG